MNPSRRTSCPSSGARVEARAWGWSTSAIIGIQIHVENRFPDPPARIPRPGDSVADVDFGIGSYPSFRDVDETVLDNYGLAELMGFGYVYELNKKWNSELKAPAILKVKELYNFLLEKGSKIIFLTGRNIPEYEVTYKNLKQAGYTVFDSLITQREHEYKLNAKEFKSLKRIELREKGYDIVGTVGDQWSDLEGVYHGIQIKIPNYLYEIK